MHFSQNYNFLCSNSEFRSALGGKVTYRGACARVCVVCVYTHTHNVPRADIVHVLRM